MAKKPLEDWYVPNLLRLYGKGSRQSLLIFDGSVLSKFDKERLVIPHSILTKINEVGTLQARI